MSHTYAQIVGACQYPIVGRKKDNKKWVVVGSCVLLELRNRYFLLTVAHVMNERYDSIDDILWLWNHTDDRKTTINEDIVGNPNKTVDHWSDVAVIEIKIDEYPNLSPNQAINLEHVALDLDAQSDAMSFILAGYPSSKNKIVGNLTKCPKLTVLVTDGRNSLVAPSLIELDFSNEMLADPLSKLPNPQGMSGGGVWKITKNEKELKLVALAVAYLGKEEKVLAIKIGVVLAVIKAHFANTILDHLDLPFQIIGGHLHIDSEELV